MSCYGKEPFELKDCTLDTRIHYDWFITRMLVNGSSMLRP